MPKFTTNTNISKDKLLESFAGELTQQLSKALANQHSIGKIGEQENKVWSKLLCDLMSKQLKIPFDRTCISFFDVSPGNVGWNNTTFA